MNALIRQDTYPTHCSTCRSGDVIVDASAGDVVCRSCGTVLRDRLEVDDSALRLEASGGEMTRFRQAHVNEANDIDVEALDDERKRKRQDEAGWGAEGGATLEQLKAAEARRRSRVTEALAALDVLGDRLQLPEHVRTRARSLLHEASSDALKAAAAAGRKATAAKRPKPEKGDATACAVVLAASQAEAYPLHPDDVARACAEAMDATSVGRAFTALVKASGGDAAAPAASACAFVAVLGDRLARRSTTFLLAPADEARAAAFARKLTTHFPHDAAKDARRVAAAAIAGVAFRDAPQSSKRGAAAQACLALSNCVPGLRATAIDALFQQARRAGLAPASKAVAHVSPDSVVALHVDQPPENAAPSLFDVGSALSDAAFA